MSAAALLVASFNGAWQGAVVCAVTYQVLRSFRRLNAATMFAVWGSLWAICVALPAASYVFAAQPYALDARETGTQQAVRVGPPSHRRVELSLSHHGLPQPAIRAHAVTATHDETGAPLRDRAAGALAAVLASAGIILWALAAIAALRVAILVRDIGTMLAARRGVRTIDPPMALRRSVRRPLKFATSAEFSSPCLLGFRPAVVVIPETILEGPKDRLLSVFLHECEHARRFDDVQNVVMRLFDALLFFCPGVLFAARQLTLYREQVCDDAVIADTGDAVSYAKTLAQMAEWTQTVRAPVPCLIFERKHLLRRVHVLLDRAASHSLRLDRRFALTAFTAVVLAAAVTLRVQLPVVADSIVQDASATTARAPRAAIEIHIHDSDTETSTSQTAEPATRKFAGMFQLSGCATTGQVRLRLEYHNFRPGHVDSDDVAACVPFSELRGLSMADLASNNVVRRTFTIVRDAGAMQAEGRIGAGAGSGTWTFSPSLAFVVELQRRGIGAPSTMQQFQWTLTNFQIATLDMLRRNGFERPSVADLVTMGDVGATNELLDAVASLPAKTKTVGELNRVAEVGVTATYIAGLERLGYRPSLEDLVALKEVGVTPSYAAGFLRLGYHPSAQELVRLKEVDVTPAWAERERSRTTGHLSIDDLIRMEERGV